MLECQYAYAIYTQVRTHSNTLTYTQVRTYSLSNTLTVTCTHVRTVLTQRNTLTYMLHGSVSGSIATYLVLLQLMRRPRPRASRSNMSITVGALVRIPV